MQAAPTTLHVCLFDVSTTMARAFKNAIRDRMPVATAVHAAAPNEWHIESSGRGVRILVSAHCGRFEDIVAPVVRAFGAEHVALVSPANSAGQMSGGIDRIYRDALPGVEVAVQRAIAERIGVTPSGRVHLGVGSALLVRHSGGAAGGTRPHMLVCPTMDHPGDNVSASCNAYHAMRAGVALLLSARGSETLLTPGASIALLCPGMCTGVGCMSPTQSARQMLDAIEHAALYGYDHNVCGDVLRGPPIVAPPPMPLSLPSTGRPAT